MWTYCIFWGAFAGHNWVSLRSWSGYLTVLASIRDSARTSLCQSLHCLNGYCRYDPVGSQMVYKNLKTSHATSHSRETSISDVNSSSASESTSRKRNRSGTIVASSRSGRSRVPSQTKHARRNESHSSASNNSHGSSVPSSGADDDEDEDDANDNDSGDDEDKMEISDDDIDVVGGQTLEQAQAILVKLWKSQHYDHFEEATLRLNQKTGIYDHIFQCKYDSSITLARRPTDSSTSNLKRHADHCTADPDTPHQITLDEWR
ncbi:hypothetical protein CYLTODRAFT_248483 [Cylindrobasidium torrendii FP15055 ss-10]|uniref:Uncharacterized protein n=1 Tax=Cylindrobasidium torrendii FP15055 ss-10 TaxID=1314674 RepID=A0A0D7ATA1_9AGAR|nr:hypothetical protein CYLTODRAFT_248483 [Cylindrobasidium torrendii FP15055 ss-10]